MPPASRDARYPEIHRVLGKALAANLLLALAKAIAGILSGTLSVVADAAHSSADALSSVLALILARVAGQAPDEEHPYGHAKFETLGALAVVAFLSITVFELVSRAITRLVTGAGQPRVTPVVAGVIVASAVVSWLISRYEHARGEELRSELLLADAAHTRSDLYSSVAVLSGLALVALGFPQADAIATLVVAAVIALAGWRILQDTVPILVDERAVEPAMIRRVAQQVPGVVACHDIRSRGRAGNVFVELTITVAPGLDVAAAHDVADEVERRTGGAVGAREVVVHVEPAPRAEAP